MSDVADALLADFTDDDDETPAPSKPPTEDPTTISIPAMTIGTLIRPKHTFETLRNAPRGHWWAVAVLGISAAAVATVFGVINEQQVVYAAIEQNAAPGQSFNSQGIIIASAVFGGIGALLALVIGGYLLRAGVVFGGALALGGKASFKQVWRMAVWTTLPEVFGFVFLALAVIITGNAAAPGLSGMLTPQEALDMPGLAAFLSAVDLYLLWGFILLAIGTTVTTRISAVKGLFIALAYYLIAVGVPTLLGFASGLLTSGLVGG